MSEVPPDRRPAADADDREEHLWRLLAGLHGQRTVVLLRGKDGVVRGTSMIMRVDSGQHQFMLDARTHEKPHPVDEKLWLESRIEGRRIEFSCRIRERRELPDGPAWVADAPELLVDEQRRGVFRLRLPADATIKAHIDHAEAPVPVAAQILDISHQGLGAQLSQVAQLDFGSRIRCTLQVDDLRLEVEAEVRYRRIDAQGTRLGLEFCELSPQQDAALSRAVLRLERQALRERRKKT